MSEGLDDVVDVDLVLRRGSEILGRLLKKYGEKGTKKFVENLVKARKRRKTEKARISGKKIRFRPVAGGVLAVDRDGVQYCSEDDIYSVIAVMTKL